VQRDNEKDVPAALPSKRRRFPFSFGVPSYLYPADIAYNVRMLRETVDEMELILFESADVSSLPTARDVAHFRALAMETGMRFNVHLPLDIDVASADERIRDNSLDVVSGIVELTSPLDPTSYTLHVPRAEGGDRREWLARVCRSLAALPRPHERFCVETLAWDLREIDDVLSDLGFSVCIDVGHLLLHGFDLPSFFDCFSGRISMIHVHGVEAGKDHLSLAHLAQPARTTLANTVMRAGYARSLSLEVFSLRDFQESLPVLEGMFPHAAGGGLPC